MALTRQDVLALTGSFTWCWGCDWFIRTDKGNFHWKDPSYGGNNTIYPFLGDLTQFYKKIKVDFGREKGVREIGYKCGENVILITDRELLAEHIYDYDPSRFYDKVDGDCRMGWLHAKADNDPKVAKAYAEADQMVEMFELGSLGFVQPA